MSERLRKNLMKYGISGGICLIYAAWHCFSRNVLEMSAVDLYRTVGDSFTVPGLLCLFAGVIVWLSNEGAFNGVGYVLKTTVYSLIFFGRRGTMETYGDYVEKQKKKKTTGYGFLFLIGAVCIAISGVFLALYYQVYS